MKFCTHCGAELNNEAVVCTKCGCAIDGMNIPYSKSDTDNYNVLAIVGFVLSFFSSIVGLIISIIAYKQIQKSGEKGKGLALAGIIIGAVITGIAVLYFICLMLMYFGVFLLILPWIGV